MENAVSSPLAETPGSRSPDGTDAALGCQTAGAEEGKQLSTNVGAEGNSGVTENVSSGEQEFDNEERASKENVQMQGTMSRGPSLGRSQSRPSLDKNKSTRITLSETPVIIEEAADSGKYAEDETGATHSPRAAASASDHPERGAHTEKLRFRPTLATYINDRKGMYDEWRAREEAAIVAREMLKKLAERVEKLLNEATAVTGKLIQRKNTLREEELQRRASSKKISSSYFSSYEGGNEIGTERMNTREGESEIQALRDAVAGQRDIGVVKGLAAQAVERLLKTALTHAEKTAGIPGQEAREEEGDFEYKRQDTFILGPDGPRHQMSLRQQQSSKFDQARHPIASHFSRSSLESYDATNFPEDCVTFKKQASHTSPAGLPKVEESASESDACDDPQLRRDKLWKIFGRETHAGKVLRPADPNRLKSLPCSREMGTPGRCVVRKARRGTEPVRVRGSVPHIVEHGKTPVIRALQKSEAAHVPGGRNHAALVVSSSVSPLVA